MRICATVTPETPGIPAQWFYGCFVISPAITVPPFACGNDRKLDISIKMSGPYDLTVRFGIARLARRHVHCIPAPTSVTFAKRPL